MTPIQEHIIDRFTTLYGVPKTDDLPKYFAEYIREMKGIRSDILRAASDIIVRNQTYPVWPTIGECRKALMAAETSLRSDPVDSLSLVERKRPPKKERQRVQAMVDAFRAHIEEMELVRLGERPVDRPTDRASWEKRQSALLAAGKFCHHGAVR